MKEASCNFACRNVIKYHKDFIARKIMDRKGFLNWQNKVTGYFETLHLIL